VRPRKRRDKRISEIAKEGKMAATSTRVKGRIWLYLFLIAVGVAAGHLFALFFLSASNR
jgi:hypothetical protein